MIRLGICNEMFEGWDLARTCRFVREVGYAGIELAPYTLAERITDLSAAQRQAIRAAIAAAGLELIGLHWLLARTTGFCLTSPDPAVRRSTGAYLLALAEATHDLGGNVMVLGSPQQRNLAAGMAYADGMALADQTLGHVLPHLDRLGVDLCLEPLGPGETNFLNTCDQAAAWIGRIGHPRLKLQLDVKAQSTEAGRTVPELVAQHGGGAGHFHAQDTNRLGPGMGSVDFAPIARALVASGYDRWASVEVFDFTPGPEKIARASFSCLTQALAACSVA